MNLIIDIGNTFTKVAIADNNKIVSIERYETLTKEVIAEILSKHSPKRAIISSVGEKVTTMVKLLKSKVPTIELDHKTKLPITNLYKTPETLGHDRIAAVVGANYLYPSSDLLVIDSGTAITYDLINSKAEYFGGAIAPGILVRYKSLHQNTINLPLLTSIENSSLIGTSTAECIESGVLNGVIGEVDYFINRVKKDFPSVQVVLTGGNSNFFVNKLKNSIFVNQNLVVIGLNRILEFNA